MLADGREWLLGGVKPGLAELHAWVFDWIVHIAPDMFVAEAEQEEAMRDIRAALPETEFPKTYAWLRRWREHVDQAERENARFVERLEGPEAEDKIVKRILDGRFTEVEPVPFDEKDALGLRRGQKVSVGPTDFGFTHVDVGRLIGLSKNEVVIEVELKDRSEGSLRLHFPRIGFKILPVEE